MPEANFTKLLECVNHTDFEQKYAKQDKQFWEKALLSTATFNGIELKHIANFMLSIEHSKKKFPPLANMPYTLIPPPEKLNAAQSSSSKTAEIKADILKNYTRIIDICGGYGVDAFYLSKGKEYLHIEPNNTLSEIAAFNFKDKKNINFINKTAEDFLHTYKPKNGDVIYADPSRVNENKQRVSLLDDYQPKVNDYPKFCAENSIALLLKLSPMLDIQALKQLWANYDFDTHLIVSNNELKELLLYFHPNCTGKYLVHSHQNNYIIENTVDLDASYNNGKTDHINYVYDANAAFRKLHAHNYLAQLYKLNFCGAFLVSETLIENFPGKVFLVKEILELDKKSKKRFTKGKYSVVSRNEKMPAKEVEKRFKLTPSTSEFLLFYEEETKAKVFVAKRVY